MLCARSTPGTDQRSAQQAARHIGEIGQTAGAAAEDQSHVVAVKRGSRSEFLNHSAEVADAHRQQFGDFGATRRKSSRFRRTPLQIAAWDR